MKRTLYLLPVLVLLALCTQAFCEEAKIRVAIFRPEADQLAAFENEMAGALETDGAFTLTPVSGEDIRNGALDKFDLIIIPGGSGTGHARAMGKDGVQKVKDFVYSGKGMFGVCAGAYFSMQQDMINADTKEGNWERGVKTLKMELTDAGRAIFGEDLKGELDVIYMNGPVVNLNIDPNGTKCEALAYFRTEVAENDSPVGIQVNSPAIWKSTFGKGTMIISSPHPEHTDGLRFFIPRICRDLAKAQGLKPAPEKAKAK